MLTPSGYRARISAVRTSLVGCFPYSSSTISSWETSSKYRLKCGHDRRRYSAPSFVRATASKAVDSVTSVGTVLVDYFRDLSIPLTVLKEVRGQHRIELNRVLAVSI